MTDNTSDSDSGSDLEWLFADDSEDEEEDTVESIQLLIGSASKKRVGRPATEHLHPDIVPCIRSFIEQNSAEAHLRRRDDVMYTNGVSLKNISDHVKNTLGISVNKNTIQRLMVPPRQKTIASKRYKHLINACVPPKRNDREKATHDDFQYTCAQVNLVNELAVIHSTNTLSLSVDNKNKVDVGIPATSRRCQVRQIYIQDNGPNYNDHDFPHPNSKLVPAGYLILKEKSLRSRSLSPPKEKNKIKKRSLSESSCFNNAALHRANLTRDKLNREKVKWPRSGPLFIQLYPSRLIESTNVMHANHLMNLINKEKVCKDVFNVTLIADGGPDWSVKGVINFVSLGMLWKKSCLDTLIIQCYAPHHSRFNPIERCWSFLTQKIVGVILPDDINGVVPSYNDNDGWMEVLDNAAKTLARFWHMKVYNGFKICVDTMTSEDPVVNKIKETHTLLKDFSNATKKKLKDTPAFLELKELYSFLVKHGNRKAYQLEFIKCEDNTCGHCSNIPVRENAFLEQLREFGGNCPAPECSEVYQGHYKTLIEMLRVSHVKRKGTFSKTTGFGSCPFGCSYIFFSQADKDRHMKLMIH